MQTGDAGSASTTVITPDPVMAELAAVKPTGARTKAKPATTATSASPLASSPPAPPTPLGTTQAATQPNADR